MRSPRIRTITFPFIAARSTDVGSVQLWDFSVFGRLVRLIGLLSVFYSSAQGFAYGFLQIPPRGGHPCFQLILPTVGRIVDFHHLVIAHVGRTKKSTPLNSRSGGASKSICEAYYSTSTITLLLRYPKIPNIQNPESPNPTGTQQNLEIQHSLQELAVLFDDRDRRHAAILVETRAGRDQVTDDDVLFETAERVILALHSGIGQDMGCLLEGSSR